MTQVQLARKLGLDRSSVSLALSNSDKIPAETRRLVLEAAQKYNYRPNLAARQLRLAKSSTLGLVLPDTFQSLSEPVVVKTIQALAKQAARKEMTFSIYSFASLLEGEDAGALMPLPDGLFLWGEVPAGTWKGRLPDGYPVLVLDPNHLSYAQDPTPSVRPDNAGGAAAMVRHLSERGAKRLLFVMGSEEHLGHVARWKGAHAEWVRRMPRASITCLPLAKVTDAVLREFSASPDGAIFCSSDQCGFAIWRRLHEMGIAMPADVKLAGFDNSPTAQLIELTSAVFDCERLAHSALDLMLKMIAGKMAAGSDHPLIPVTIQKGCTT